MNWRRIGIIGGGTLLLIVSLGAIFGLPTQLLFTPTETGAAAGLTAEDVDSEIVAEDLDVPWEVIVLDDDRFLVTERTGDLLLIEDGQQHVIESFDELA